jgi:3-dehydrosphinganine reductase
MESLKVGLVPLVCFLVCVCVVIATLNRRRCAFNLANKHVVITGGSSGIGKEIARQALANGAKVTIMARNMETLLLAKKELDNEVKSVFKTTIVSVDCGSGERAVADAFQVAVSSHGDVDVLVNCAGTSVPGVFEELDESVFQQMMHVNYFGAVSFVV